ncbi:MAG: CehA/McbA family metallohydrolase [Cyanobacteriota bacterium]
MKNYEYPGAIHIHSTYSDGTSTIEDIAKDAKRAGLRWIIITDHNTLEGLDNGREGYYEDLCVMVGLEISPEEGNHYLAFDIKENINHEQPAQNYIKEVNDQGGFGFIAHPDEMGGRDNPYPPLRWDDWDINGFQGIEIWNFMSDWVDTLTTKNKIKKFLYPVESLHGPTAKTITWWDKLNNQNNKIVPAIAGLDEHCFRYNYIGLNLKVFPYYKTFKTLLNYIQIDDFLSNDFETAKKQIYKAIKSGNNIMINNKLGNYSGTVFTATKRDLNQKYVKSTAGEILEIENDFIIDIETPQPSEIKLFHNGKEIKSEMTRHLKFKSNEPGSYRFEAFKNGKHWILSNPIKVIKAND